jgi:hypothetical protein
MPFMGTKGPPLHTPNSNLNQTNPSNLNKQQFYASHLAEDEEDKKSVSDDELDEESLASLDDGCSDEGDIKLNNKDT